MLSRSTAAGDVQVTGARSLPPIDADKPASVETATFAAG